MNFIPIQFIWFAQYNLVIGSSEFVCGSPEIGRLAGATYLLVDQCLDDYEPLYLIHSPQFNFSPPQF